METSSWGECWLQCHTHSARRGDLVTDPVTEARLLILTSSSGSWEWCAWHLTAGRFAAGRQAAHEVPQCGFKSERESPRWTTSLTAKTERGCDGNDPCGRVWGLEVGRRECRRAGGRSTGSEACRAVPLVCGTPRGQPSTFCLTFWLGRWKASLAEQQLVRSQSPTLEHWARHLAALTDLSL